LGLENAVKIVVLPSKKFMLKYRILMVVRKSRRRQYRHGVANLRGPKTDFQSAMASRRAAFSGDASLITTFLPRKQLC